MATNYQDPRSRTSRQAAAARKKRRRRQARIRLCLYAVMVALIVAGVWMIVRAGDRAPEPVVLSIPTATPVPVPGQETPVPQMEITPEPTPENTPEPTPVPTPAPTEYVVTSEYDFNYTVLEGIPQTNRELGIQGGEMVDFSYFDDAVFVGDSVSLKLYQYVKKHRQNDAAFMGKAQFLTAGSLGSGNALASLNASNSVHPSYMGTKMLIEDAVARMGVKKVYIMLGMNDIALYGIDASVDNMMQLCWRIKKQSPDVEIYIQSATPRLKGDYGKLNNENLFLYNQKLYQACAEKGYHFVDVAYIMRDAEGNLPPEYCSDPEGQALHFTDVACKKWIDYLRTHTVTD